MRRRLAKIASLCRSLAGYSGRDDRAARADNTSRVFPLPTDECGAWIAQARTVAPFVCDAVFRLEPSFYVGPANGMTSLEWATANVRLPPVDLPRQFADRVATAELLGREDALVAHYRGIIAIAGAHGKAGSLRPFPYFRTQPAIIADGQVLTEFSWNDDVHETRTVLEVLAGSIDGPARLLHDDQDQGWHILIAATGPATCFIEWDAEGPPPVGEGYAFDPAELARQAAAALERLQVIHRRLIGALGRDYWT